MGTSKRERKYGTPEKDFADGVPKDTKVKKKLYYVRIDGFSKTKDMSLVKCKQFIKECREQEALLEQPKASLIIWEA